MLSLNGPVCTALLGGIAARANFTDKDIVDFLVNVECLEGSFDTWGTFGHGFISVCASRVPSHPPSAVQSRGVDGFASSAGTVVHDDSMIRMHTHVHRLCVAGCNQNLPQPPLSRLRQPPLAAFLEIRSVIARSALEPFERPDVIAVMLCDR